MARKQHTSGQAKWALLIGINTYPLWGDSQQLRGCVNDVMLARSILKGN